MRYHILVVDDEKPARTKTIRFIKELCPDSVVTQAQDGIEALAIINDHTFDIVFLDIQMPGLTGFDVIKQLSPYDIPPVVFITAYDEYAIKAFDVHAVDYLLKPFDFDRFKIAFERVVKMATQSDDIKKKIDLLLKHANKKEPYLDRITIKKDERIFFVNTNDINHIKAQGRYIEIHVGKANHLLRKTLQSTLKRLDPDRFFRIHKSHVVNIDHIRELQTCFHGDYNVILKDGTELRLSRRYSKALLSRLE